ncbi:MAG: hypothetical protein M1837_005711 [Sclerophora amabilis]|nr:MAG: hypothetical protein M1837_005711 [Sclerophora amabilis]
MLSFSPYRLLLVFSFFTGLLASAEAGAGPKALNKLDINGLKKMERITDTKKRDLFDDDDDNNDNDDDDNDDGLGDRIDDAADDIDDAFSDDDRTVTAVATTTKFNDEGEPTTTIVSVNGAGTMVTAAPWLEIGALAGVGVIAQAL